VVAGGFFFSAGQIPLDPATSELVEGGIAEQTERVLQSLGAVLEAAGSSFDRVVKTTCFLADLDDFAGFNAVYARYFGGQPAGPQHRPGRKTAEGLPRRGGVHRPRLIGNAEPYGRLAARYPDESVRPDRQVDGCRSQGPSESFPCLSPAIDGRARRRRRRPSRDR
jgi:reactive intermediate/imine deaminase